MHYCDYEMGVHRCTVLLASKSTSQRSSLPLHCRICKPPNLIKEPQNSPCCILVTRNQIEKLLFCRLCHVRLILCTLVFMGVPSTPGFVIFQFLSHLDWEEISSTANKSRERNSAKSPPELSETPRGSSAKEYFHGQLTTVSPNTLSLSFSCILHNGKSLKCCKVPSRAVK